MAGSAAERLDGLLVLGQLAEALYRPAAGHARVGAVGTAERGHDHDGRREPTAEGKPRQQSQESQQGQAPADQTEPGAAHAPPEQPVRLEPAAWEPVAVYTPDRHLTEPSLSGKQCDWRA